MTGPGDMQNAEKTSGQAPDQPFCSPGDECATSQCGKPDALMHRCTHHLGANARMRCCHLEKSRSTGCARVKRRVFLGKALKMWCQPEETVAGGRGTKKKSGRWWQSITIISRQPLVSPLQTETHPEYSFLHDIPAFWPAILADRLSCRPCRFPEEGRLSADVPRGKHIVYGKAEQ